MPILPEHKEILLSQSKSKTLPEWASFFEGKYSKQEIYNFCYQNRKVIKKITLDKQDKNQERNIKKYGIRQDYFKTWNNKMAYIFGFWFAKGCIYQEKCFDITISKKDKYILKRIAEELQYEGTLYDSVDKQVVRLNFCCKIIYDDLMTLCGTEQKSNTIIFPKIPKKFLADFIRGYFDAKGDIMNLKNNRINTVFLSENEQFLKALLEVLRTEADVTGGSYDPYNKVLRFGTKDSVKIGLFIYQNDPELFLLRKRKKFLPKEEKL